MAEKEADDALENDLLDEDNLNIAEEDSSKPMLIKIIIGLIALLIIAVGVYFFFMSSDKPAAEEAFSETNEKIILPEIVPPAITLESDETKNDADNAEQLELVKMREETASLKAENLKIKEQLKELEAKQSADLAATKVKIANTKKTSKRKVEKNPYANLYVKDDHLIRQPTPKKPHKPMIEQAPPEPKWGDFDPLYRGK